MSHSERRFRDQKEKTYLFHPSPSRLYLPNNLERRLKLYIYRRNHSSAILYFQNLSFVRVLLRLNRFWRKLLNPLIVAWRNWDYNLGDHYFACCLRLGPKSYQPIINIIAPFNLQSDTIALVLRSDERSGCESLILLLYSCYNKTRIVLQFLLFRSAAPATNPRSEPLGSDEN